MMRSLLLVSVLFLGCEASSAQNAKQVATISAEQINESSGLAASHATPGALWVHNDSGDKARLYQLDSQGRLTAIVKLKGADADDWEDMCSFVLDGQPWLLIGDIGDNARQRGKKNSKCRLYLVKELPIPRANGLPTVTWNVAAEIKYEYEDGRWDCEGVAVDSQRKEILLLTKESPLKSGLYSLPLDVNSAEQKLEAKRIGTPFIPFATALDVDRSGQTLVVGTMFNGLIVKRAANQSWENAFKTPGRTISLPPRKQGETICFDASGEWLFLNSEGNNQPLWKMPVE